MSDEILIIIPVRGKSKGIPRKNARLLNGKPLLSYSIEAAKASQLTDNVFVTTDDPELEMIAERYGAHTVQRSESLSDDLTGLDAVAYHTTLQIEEKFNKTFKYVITIQATCPLLKAETIRESFYKLLETNDRTLVSATNDTHLRWKLVGNKAVKDYDKRLNRQLLPQSFKETGGVCICYREDLLHHKTRFSSDVCLFEISKNESIDIDDYFDWWMCEKLLKRKKIILNCTGSKENGLGHVYRQLTIADRLIDHDVVFATDEKSHLAIEKIKSRFYPLYVYKDQEDLLDFCQKESSDLVINDVLQTTESFINSLKGLGIKTINFEDSSPGSQVADILINAIYKTPFQRESLYEGLDYCCLRDEFYGLKPIAINKEAKTILVLFGGTDPLNLTLKTLQALQSQNQYRVQVILGLGVKDTKEIETIASQNEHINLIRNTTVISKYMSESDICISSSGRTLFELASLGIPTVAYAAGPREMTHSFPQENEGIAFLGAGDSFDSQVLQKTLAELNSSEKRLQMQQHLLDSNIINSTDRVLALIMGVFDE